MKLNFALFATLLSIILVTASIVSAEDVIRIGVGIVVRPGGSSSSGSTSTQSGTCGNNVTSCGTWPNCIDVSKLKYCTGGHVVQTYCSSNTPKNQSKTQQCNTSGLIGGYNLQVNITNANGLTKRINIFMYTPGTNSLVVSGTLEGEGLISAPQEIEDMKFDFDNQKFAVNVRSLNVSKLTGNLSNLIIDKPPVAINGADIYKAYHVELPSTFTYSNITITIDFSDMSVRNVTNLKFYRCGSFNPTTNNCNEEWTLMNPTSINSAAKTATLDISGFSVYALGEPKQGGTTSSTSTTTTSTTSTTTQSTTQTTTQPPASSGSSYTPPASTTTTVTTTVIIEPEPEPEEEIASTTTNATNATTTSTQTAQMTSGFASFASPAVWIIPVLVVGGLFAWKYNLLDRMTSHEIIRVTPKKKFRYHKGKTGETKLVLS